MQREGYDPLVARAGVFGASAPMVLALGDVARDERFWEQANKDLDGFLEERGIEVPDGLSVRPIAWPELGRPGPDWEPFTIRLTVCRRVWVRGDDGMIREETFCRGFDVIRHPVPDGPRG
jgi:hypothetical protein